MLKIGHLAIRCRPSVPLRRLAKSSMLVPAQKERSSRVRTIVPVHGSSFHPPPCSVISQEILSIQAFSLKGD